MKKKALMGALVLVAALMLVAVVAPTIVKLTNGQKVPASITYKETKPGFEATGWYSDGEVTWWVDDPVTQQVNVSLPSGIRPLGQIESSYLATPEEIVFYGWWG